MLRGAIPVKTSSRQCRTWRLHKRGGVPPCAAQPRLVTAGQEAPSAYSRFTPCTGHDFTMADSLCLQNWISLGGDNSATVVQDADDWLEIADFADVAAYLEVA